jgi:hypothetical protein
LKRPENDGYSIEEDRRLLKMMMFLKGPMFILNTGRVFQV